MPWHYDISNHWQSHCFSSLFLLMTKEISKLCITAPLWEGSPGHQWIPFPKGHWCGKHYHVNAMKSSWQTCCYHVVYCMHFTFQKNDYIKEGLALKERWKHAEDFGEDEDDADAGCSDANLPLEGEPSDMHHSFVSSDLDPEVGMHNQLHSYQTASWWPGQELLTAVLPAGGCLRQCAYSAVNWGQCRLCEISTFVGWFT